MVSKNLSKRLRVSALLAYVSQNERDDQEQSNIPCSGSQLMEHVQITDCLDSHVRSTKKESSNALGMHI